MKIKYEVENPQCAPYKKYLFDVGFDLASNEDVVLVPGEVYKLSLGVRVDIPSGYWALLTHRSSLASKLGCTLSLGVIDSTYKKDLKALVINHSNEYVRIKKGDRVAQLIIMPITPLLLEEGEVEEGGKDGFGSTGK